MEQLYFKEVDEKEESTRKYQQFIDLYIQLYYEPLEEEYEELKYFTKNHDEKMMRMIGGNKIKSI